MQNLRTLHPGVTGFLHRLAHRTDFRVLLVHACSSSPAATANGKSAYRGVSWNKRRQAWETYVQDPTCYRKVHLGHFHEELAAAAAVDCAMLVMKGEAAHTNLDRGRYTLADIQKAERVIEQRRSTAWKVHTSFKGVTKDRRRGRWKAQIQVASRPRFLGYFNSDSEAAAAYDAALRASQLDRSVLLQKLNFKRRCDYFSETDWSTRPIPETKTSRFTGVSWNSRGKYFEARCRGKSLGCFKEEVEAARAFDFYSWSQGGATNFHPDSLALATAQTGMGDCQLDSMRCVGKTSISVRSVSTEQHHTDEFTRPAIRGIVCRRKEQPLTLALQSSLASQGHKVGARCYYELRDGADVFIARCDLYDHTTRTVYEVKSKVGIPEICAAVGQLHWYRHLEQAASGDSEIRAVMAVPAEGKVNLSESIQAFFVHLKQSGIDVVFVDAQREP